MFGRPLDRTYRGKTFTLCSLLSPESRMAKRVVLCDNLVMATLYFTREFTRGNLKGARHYDRISFPTAADCMAWVETINRTPSKVNYRIVDRSFQCYARNVAHRG